MKREIPLGDSAMEETESGSPKRETKPGGKVQIRMTNLAIGSWGVFQPFRIYTVSQELALSFVKTGDAEILE